QHLPALWDSDRLRPAQKKELLRTLIRRVVLSKPAPDRVEVKVVWVSGAFSTLTVHPVLHRAVDVGDYDRLVERVRALAAEGYQDGEIARRVSAEGFRGARTPTRVPKRLVFRIRQRHGQPSL